MDVSSVCVSCNNILKTSFKDFVSKLYSDFVCCFVIYLARCKRLYQMQGECTVCLFSVFLNLIELIKCDFRRAAISINEQFVVGFLRVHNIIKSFVQGSCDRMDFSNCHISSCFCFISCISLRRNAAHWRDAKGSALCQGKRTQN